MKTSGKFSPFSAPPFWNGKETRRLNEIAVSDRGTSRALTRFQRTLVVARRQTVEREEDGDAMWEFSGVCDNLF